MAQIELPEGFTPLESSNLAGYKYDPGTKRLDVIFQNGSHYHYDGVPGEAVRGLKEADSAGKYFNRFIARSYTYHRH